MPRAPKRWVKRVSGQEGYKDTPPRRISSKGWNDTNHFFSVRRRTDYDFDEQVYWCISGGLSTVCLNENEAVALRELLPGKVVGGSIESLEEDWHE